MTVTMTAIALKQYIANKIVSVDDNVILEKIKSLIDSMLVKDYELSTEQIILLNESQVQYHNGDFIEESVMDKKVEEWQKTK